MTRAELDPNLRQAVAIGTPVEVVDPATNQVFYLVSADRFRLLTSGATAFDDPREMYPLVDCIMAVDDANDPLLASYQ